MIKSGFTFIELLVSLSIMLLFSGLLIAGYSRFNSSQTLSQAASTLVSNLTAARTNAKFGVKPTGCDSLVGYEADFPSSTSYTTTALCMVSGSEEEIGVSSVYPLAGGVAFSPVPANPVIFLPLGQGVVSPESIVLQENTFTKTVSIAASGMMSIQ